MGDVWLALWWKAWPLHLRGLWDGMSSLIPLCNTIIQSISEKGAKTWQRKLLKENSESGVCIPSILSVSSTLLYSVPNTRNTQIEKTVVVELGNSYSTSVNRTEARLWCKTFQCLHQATGSEDSQGDLSLFTRRKNSCCTGPLNFPAPRSALWILPSAFPKRGPCTSEGAAPSPRAMIPAGLGAGYFLSCELLCWIRK